MRYPLIIALLAAIIAPALSPAPAQAVNICKSLHGICVVFVGGSCDAKTGLKYPPYIGISGEAAYYQCVRDKGREMRKAGLPLR